MNSASQFTSFLRKDLASYSKELEQFPDDKTIWEIMPGIKNSVGVLVQHILGNLNYFIGGILGKTGYERNRDAEFLVSDKTREQLKKELSETSAMVEKVLANVPDEKLSEDFPVQLGGTTLETRIFLMRLCSHSSYHLGQANYLRRILTDTPAAK